MSRRDRPFALRALAGVPGARAAGRRVRGLQAAVRLATDPEQARAYGGEGGKPTWRRVADNVLWAARYGNPNPLYYAYGMDEKTGTSYARYHLAEKVAREVNRQIEEDGAGHATAVLRDKYFFSLIAQTLGHPSPRTLALMGPLGVDLLNPRRPLSYEGLVSQSLPLDGFAKPIGGAQGAGAFALRIEGGQAWVDGEPAGPADVGGRVDGRYLLQERVEQHPALAALHPASLNTVRLVTVLRDGHAEPVVACLRVGARGALVDNWAAGGLIVGLDIETGALFGKGIRKPPAVGGGAVFDRHPDTGVQFDGYALPYVPAALDLARRFHRDMGGPRSIGWDLAFTPTGPCIIEGNSHWNLSLHLAIDPGFLEPFVRASGIDAHLGRTLG